MMASVAPHKDSELFDDEDSISSDSITLALSEDSDNLSESDTPVVQDVEAMQNLESCIAANKLLQKKIQKLHTRLQKRLEFNRKVEEEVRSRLKEIQCRSAKLQGDVKEFRHQGNWFRPFGSPYFKDPNGFPAPYMDKIDESLYKETNLIPLNRDVKPWKSIDIITLEDAVKEILMKMHLSHLMLEKEKCMKQKRTKAVMTEKESKVLQERIDSLTIQIETVSNMSIEELYKNVGHDIDWAHISNVNMEKQRTKKQCELYWKHNINPAVNHSNWTSRERQKLLELVKMLGNDNWNSIADILGGRRTAFQCFEYYAAVVQPWKRSKWTPEDDRKVLWLTKKYRQGSTILWNKVYYHINEFTRDQVYVRWNGSLNPAIRKGRFNIREDTVILKCMQKFGPNFPLIALHVPGRTSVQIRDRYHCYLKESIAFGSWTVEEDKRLIQAVQSHRRKWSFVAKQIPTRTASSCFRRYQKISKTMEMYPGVPVEKLPLERRMRLKPKALLEKIPEKQTDAALKIQDPCMKSCASVKKGNKRKRGIEINFDPLSMSIDDDIKVLRQELKMAKWRKACSKSHPEQPKELEPGEQALVTFFSISHARRNGRQKNIYLDSDIAQYVDIMHRHLENMQTKLKIPLQENLLANKNLTELEIQILDGLRDKQSSAGESRSVLKKKQFFIPPQRSTLIGFRSLLLHRSFLCQAVVNTPIEMVSLEEPSAKDVSDTFKKNFFKTFFWPVLMSQHPPATPSNPFEDSDQEDCSQETNPVFTTVQSDSVIRGTTGKRVKYRRRAPAGCVARKFLKNKWKKWHEEKAAETPVEAKEPPSKKRRKGARDRWGDLPTREKKKPRTCRKENTESRINGENFQ